MEQIDLLRRVVGVLERLDIPYMVDRQYVSLWAGQMGLSEIWRMILDRLDKGRAGDDERPGT